MTKTKINKTIVIVGPTASGKTGLAIFLAKKLNGEIISADSRQVYKKMDIGTGKDLKEYGTIKYHCIDLVNPNTEFNLAKYKKSAEKAIISIQNRNKCNSAKYCAPTPIIVGGTGLYINSIIYNYELKNESINKNFRKELESKTKEDLQKILLELDDKAKDNINNSDWNNPYRLIRKIEKKLADSTIKSEVKANGRSPQLLDYIILGISLSKESIIKNITQRAETRFKKEGMIEEVYNLHYKYKISWKRLISFGLEYKIISNFLIENIKKQKNIKKFIQNILENNSKEYTNLKEKLITESWQYAKRQMTWFRKDKNIIWVDGEDIDRLREDVLELINNF